MYRRFFSLIVVLFIVMNIAYAQEEHWMPDPKLRKAVRDKLGVPADNPLTQAYVQLHLTNLEAINKGIVDLTGLEHATDLQFLALPRNEIHDISPLSGLLGLVYLVLDDNQISDLSPLAGLVNLEELRLGRNQIREVSPLAGLVNLKVLSLSFNQIVDLSPLAGLPNLENLEIQGNEDNKVLSTLPRSKLMQFGYDETCDLPGVPISERIENREYPSIFSAWGNIINLPNLSWKESLAYHDEHWGSLLFGLQWLPTSEGLKTLLHVESAKEYRDEMLSLNPNMIFIVGMNYWAVNPGEYPDDWPHWVRDESGERIVVDEDSFLIDFTQPEVRDFMVRRAVAFAKCGLFDGIFLDVWRDDWRNRENAHYYTYDLHEAAITMLRRIREEVDAVRDDFLIIVNTNDTKIPHSAPYVNGMFMETIGPYTRQHLAEIESTLLWGEQNLRAPQINSLEGWGIKSESLDSPKNQQRMRLFTTMSLAFSDGYVLFSDTYINFHNHYWYPFWDADLGRPVGGDETKGVLYETPKGVSIEGLFIREFTNGWAVYNRSGKERKIYLPEKVSAVASGVKNKHWHTIPDLDGEIFLKKATPRVNQIKKTTAPADVNNDGKVNIDDIRLVIAAIGVEPTTTTRADVNEDGTVNVVDLQIVIDNLDNPTTAEAPTLRDDLSGTFNAALLRAELLRLGTDTQQLTEAIALLKYLLASTLPEQTQLLANYPNPFNPETWIPYHLATDTHVEIRIYDTRGSLVRSLELGHQRAGIYTGRGRAAYWDGRNDIGERVASGIYFYQLQTENLSSVRKMLILK